MKKILLGIAVVLITITACTEEQINTIIDATNNELTLEEMAAGLKEALTVGTDTSTAILGKRNGYLNDPTVKILLPAQTRAAIENFKSKQINLGFTSISGNTIYNGTTILGITIPGLKSQEDALLEGINHAAEDAAAVAGPIFKGAITSMTINDASSILFSEVDTAATAFLYDRTYVSLYNQYEPRIDNALKNVKVGNESVADSYESFVNQYNSVLQTSIPGFGSLGSLMNLNPILAADLSAHGTAYGLQGLFEKVAAEERDIRNDPFARVSSLLERVFGALD